MVRDPQWHCCWERKIYFHCIINFHNLMSLALDNRFIYPAHMMRSLKVHPLSDQFCSVNGSTCRDHKNILTWFLYFFFFILNSIFNCTFLFLLQITCWHCSDFFFFLSGCFEISVSFFICKILRPLVRINKCHFKYSPVCNDHLTEYYLLDKYHRNRWIKYTGPV